MFNGSNVCCYDGFDSKCDVNTKYNQVSKEIEAENAEIFGDEDIMNEVDDTDIIDEYNNFDKDEINKIKDECKNEDDDVDGIESINDSDADDEVADYRISVNTLNHWVMNACIVINLLLTAAIVVKLYT